MSVVDLKKRFVQAKIEREKLSLAIDIIDSAELHRYSKLSEFDAAFGTNFDGKREKLGRAQRATVILYFQQQNESARDDMATDYTGWYLVLKYDSGGHVVDYYISNAHK